MAILRVPSDYPSLSAAVAAAAPGDTIQIAASYSTAETVTVSVDDLTIIGKSAAASVIALSGVGNIRIGGTLAFDVIADDGGATIHGSAGPNRLTGGENIDRIYAGTGDTVDAKGGNDVIYLSGKPVKVDGGDGSDLVRINASMSFAAGSLANVERFSVASGKTVYFDAVEYGIVVQSVGAESATPTVVRGTAFDDLFYAGVGADRFVGNAGTDTVSYLYATAGVTADLAHSENNTGWAAGDTLVGIENLIGSKAGDTLSGNAFVNRIDGGAGDDTITAGRGDILIGGTGSDTFIIDGSRGLLPASIEGDIAGSSRRSFDNDRILITGNTTLSGPQQIAHIEEIAVANGVTADLSQASAPGFFVYRSLSETGGASTIKAFDHAGGTAAWNIFVAGEGADTLVGNGRYSFINLVATPTLIDGGAGDGNIYVTGDVTFTADNVRNIHRFTANPGYDVDLTNVSYGGLSITGNGGGGAGTSNLTGSRFDDRIYGYENGGTYTGGKGRDIIIGAWGDPETFVYNAGDTGITQPTVDQFAGFASGKDHIHLGGVALSEDRYAEVQLTSESFDDALSHASALMADGSKDIVYVGGGGQGFDHEYAGWLFWKTDASLVAPDQAIQYDGGHLITSFGFGDLV